MEIPNFFETKKEIIKELYDVKFIGEITWRQWGSTPTFDVEFATTSIQYKCDITTGQWGRSSTFSYLDFMFLVTKYDNEVLQKRVQTLEKQVAELMSLFDHVRETETNMDAFLTTARKCVKAQEALKTQNVNVEESVKTKP